MPTYEYRCSDCANRYETREGFDAPPRQSCPRCGAQARRVLHAPMIVFKGSGFYVNDSRNKNGASSEPSTASETAGTSDSSSPDSSSTPAPAVAADSSD